MTEKQVDFLISLGAALFLVTFFSGAVASLVIAGYALITSLGTVYGVVSATLYLLTWLALTVEIYERFDHEQTNLLETQGFKKVKDYN